MTGGPCRGESRRHFSGDVVVLDGVRQQGCIPSADMIKDIVIVHDDLYAVEWFFFCSAGTRCPYVNARSPLSLSLTTVWTRLFYAQGSMGMGERDRWLHGVWYWESARRPSSSAPSPPSNVSSFFF